MVATALVVVLAVHLAPVQGQEKSSLHPRVELKTSMGIIVLELYPTQVRSAALALSLATLIALGIGVRRSFRR